MNTVRSEDGLHPYFAVFVKRMTQIKNIERSIDPSVHITPTKMSIIKGTYDKLKITQFFHNPKIVFIKLYGQKVVQSFFLEFGSEGQSKSFVQQIQRIFKEEIVN